MALGPMHLPLPLQNSSLVLELWGFIWALRRPPASSWVPQGPYSQGASERGCMEQVDVQRVSRTRPQDAFLPHGALGPAGLCLCPERRGERGSHRSPDVLCRLSAKGSGSRAPIGVTSGEVPVVDTPCWSERQGHHLNCTVCGAKSSKACGEVFRRI